MTFALILLFKRFDVRTFITYGAKNFIELPLLTLSLTGPVAQTTMVICSSPIYTFSSQHLLIITVV